MNLEDSQSGGFYLVLAPGCSGCSGDVNCVQLWAGIGGHIVCEVRQRVTHKIWFKFSYSDILQITYQVSPIKKGKESKKLVDIIAVDYSLRT